MSRADLQAAKNELIARSGTGRVYCAPPDAESIDRLTDAHGQLRDLPAGYLRIGSLRWVSDPAEIVVRVDSPANVRALGLDDDPIEDLQLLVLFYPTSAAGDEVYIGQHFPAARLVAPPDRDARFQARGHQGLGFAARTMFGGPGWRRRLDDAGVPGL